MKVSDIQVDLIGHYGSDLSVVNAARVSFHKESEWDLVEREITEKDISQNIYPDYPIERILTPKLKLSDEKLINYLAKHKHFSPFNHAFLSFRVKAPLFVARQLVKHKFLPWNEVSRRYVDEEPEFYFPEYWRKKADNVKQGSSEEPANDQAQINYHIGNAVSQCVIDYREALAQGVCAEQARMILPQNMMTEWVWSGTLGAWCDMLVLRLDPHTQYESRIVAEKARDLIAPIFPVSLKARLEAN